MKIATQCFAASIVLVGASAASASIIGPFTTGGTGSFALDGADIEIDGTVDTQNPDYDFETVDATLTLAGFDPMTTFTGSFVLSGTEGDLFADMAGDVFGINTPFAAIAGDFVITGGTGIFTDAIGSGVVSAFTDNNTGSVQFKIAGTIIPAPAGLAALAGLGLLGSRRRRQ